jgi:hypothetical protein
VHHLLVTVSCSKGHIPYFFAAIEREAGFVKEWGVCNSTLEEVFLRLVKSNKAVTEGADDKGKGARSVTLLTKNHVPVVVTGNFDLSWADKTRDGVPTENDLLDSSEMSAVRRFLSLYFSL